MQCNFCIITDILFCLVYARHAPGTLICVLNRFCSFQQAALVLNASRRFRYTLDLKKEEERKQLVGKIRTHAQVIRVYYFFFNHFFAYASYG